MKGEASGERWNMPICLNHSEKEDKWHRIRQDQGFSCSLFMSYIAGVSQRAGLEAKMTDARYCPCSMVQCQRRGVTGEPTKLSVFDSTSSEKANRSFAVRSKDTIWGRKKRSDMAVATAVTIVLLQT